MGLRRWGVTGGLAKSWTAKSFLGGWTGGRLAFTGGGAPEAWDDTKGVLQVVECFSRVWVETLNFTYPLETTRCFIYLLNI